MKKKIIILASIVIIISFVAWKLYDNYKMFSIISWIVTIVSGLIGIYVFGDNKDIVTKQNERIEEQKDLIKMKQSVIEDLEAKNNLLTEQLKKSTNTEKKNQELKAEIKENEKLIKLQNEKILECYTKIDELEKQLEKIKGLKETDIKTNSSLYKKAYNLFLKGNIKKALNILSVKNLEKQKDIELWFLRAKLLGIKGDYDKEFECYEKIIELNPDDAKAYNSMGWMSVEKGNYNKAIEYCEKAIELKPDYAMAYNNVGVAYYNKGNYNKAIEYYEKSLELKSDFDFPYYNMGLIYQYLGDFDKAIEYYGKSLELIENVDAYYGMGLAYQYLGNQEKANECFQKASMIRHNVSFTEYQDNHTNQKNRSSDK